MLAKKKEHSQSITSQHCFPKEKPMYNPTFCNLNKPRTRKSQVQIPTEVRIWRKSLSKENNNNWFTNAGSI